MDEYIVSKTQIIGVDGGTPDAIYRSARRAYLAASALATGITLDMVPACSLEWKGSLGVQYEMPLSAYGSLITRIDATSQSSMYANSANAPSNYLSGYTAYNARLAWRSTDTGKWQVALDVQNLFNNSYFVRRDDLLNQIGTILATPARPRTYMVTLRA